MCFAIEGRCSHLKGRTTKARARPDHLSSPSSSSFFLLLSSMTIVQSSWSSWDLQAAHIMRTYLLQTVSMVVWRITSEYKRGQLGFPVIPILLLSQTLPNLQTCTLCFSRGRGFYGLDISSSS